MATLPRYQQMGIQYADLPRISTAGIEAGAKSMDVLGQSLDRMISFAYDRQATEAQKKAQQYAIQNPLTKSQVEEALSTGQGTKVKGAGRIFQQTYDKVQASLLSTELQLEANKALTAVNATIESGQPFNLDTIQTEIKDMIDGYTSIIMALDADQALRFKAAATTAGNSIYQKAADRAVKVYQAQNEASFQQGLIDVRPVLESIFESVGSIDAETGKPIDVESLIEIQRRPFMDSVAIFGNAKFLNDFNKEVLTAKKNALTAFMTDRTRYETASDALRDINSNDFGNLSSVYRGLTQDQKQAVRDNVMKSFANDHTAFTQDKARQEFERKEEWAALSIQFLNPNTSSTQKRQIVNRGVQLNQISIQTAESLLKPSEGKANPMLFVQLNDMIQRGQLDSFEVLASYRNQLSDQEFKTLGTGITSAQGRMAVANMNRHVGIRENQFVPEDKNAKSKVIMDFYMEELGKQVPGPSGVPVFQSPTQAMDAAIIRFDGDKSVQSALAAQESIKRRIDALFKENPRAVQPGLPIEQIDPEMIRGLSGPAKADLQKLIKDYRDNVNSMSGR